MMFLAERCSRRDAACKPLVLMGSEVPFPFRTRPSATVIAGMPAGTIACMPLLEEWGVPSRLASRSDFAGCFHGFRDGARGRVARRPSARRNWPRSRSSPAGRRRCSRPPPRLARRLQLPCQVSLEEFMACAVGGCAGCTVEVRTPQGPAMKRVCVDGPVFDAYTVF